ncbi:putative leader peptide [Streptomyces sp. NPDC046887]
MVAIDVTETAAGSVLLVARLHVDLCRLASAICPPGPPGAAHLPGAV